MEKTITNFKNSMIEEIKKSYEKNKSVLIENYRKDLFLLYRLKNINNIRKIYIQSLTQSYQSNLKSLTNEMNKNITNVSNYKIEFPITEQEEIVHNKMALLIGINYRNTENELLGCINDANNIKEFLIKKGFEQNAFTLTDDTFTKPTRQNIIDQLKTLLTNSRPGDTVFFSYSGHGSYILDKNGDEKDGNDEMIIPLDLQPILDDELKDIIQKNLKKDVTLFALFDSCHSGTVLDLKYQYLDSTNYDHFTENNNNLETLGNVYMISGSMDNQTSMDAYINNKSQGAMTWSFLTSLKELQNPTWRELVKNMRNLLKTNGFEQIPQFCSGNKLDIDTPVWV